MRKAVEELLRYDSPVQMTARHIMEDFEYGGRQFKQGQQINFRVWGGQPRPGTF